jgi:hypothetical protein
VFDDLEKPKLVNYCKDLGDYDQYILRELQLYRVYQLLTPISHRVRLTRISYVDSASKKREAERWAIIEEDPDQLANRLSGQLLKTKGASVADFEAPQLALAYLFEYFIGNLDFSFMGLHNTELLLTNNGQIFPIAYDFDFSGLADTRYATPDPQLPIKRVRDRLYRGPCKTLQEVEPTLAGFRSKKANVLAVYDSLPALDKRYAEDSKRYLEDFFRTLDRPGDTKREMVESCQRQPSS